MMTLRQATRIAIVIEADDTGRLMAFITALTALIGIIVAVVEFVAFVVDAPFSLAADLVKCVAMMPFGNRVVWGVG